MKYIVTGGAGFIGSNLVDQLIVQGNEVHVIDNFSSGKKENCNKDALYHEYDISDNALNDKFVQIMEKADSVFHTAALARVQPSIEDPISYELNNTIGTINMLKCAVDAGVKRLIYSGSSAVYGNSESLPSRETDSINPLSPYGVQKYYGEVLCKMFSQVYTLETVSLRYFNVYGERQNISEAYALVIGIFLNQVINNQPMTIRGDGEQKRDFCYVGDVVSANILASKSKNVGNGEVINIGNGNNHSVNQIADLIGDERMFIDSVLEPRATLSDNTKAKDLLGWSPKTKIDDWIQKYKSKLGL